MHTLHRAIRQTSIVSTIATAALISTSALSAPLGAPWITTGFAQVVDANGSVEIGGPTSHRIGSPIPSPQLSGTALLNGGANATVDNLQVGFSEGDSVAEGAARISGSGTNLVSNHGVTVFDRGSLTVENGAKVQTLLVGAQSTSDKPAVLTIIGPGSQLDGANEVSVVDNSHVQVSDGGELVSTFGSVDIGGFGLANAIPVVTIDGWGSQVRAGTSLTIGVELGNPMNPGEPAELVLRNGGMGVAPNITIGTVGTVKGNSGTLQGVVENRGTIAPGESPGTLNIVGDLTQTATGKLVIEIGGKTPGLFDVLNVSGKLTLGGTLEVDLLNGFTPGANDTLNFLTFGSIAGAFDHFILPTFGNGQTLHLNFGPNGIALSASAVPIPAAAWLFMSALGGLGLMRRRAVIQR